MLEGRSPFSGPSKEKIFDSIIRNEPEYSENLSLDARELLPRLLEKNPTKRAKLYEIKTHSFFSQIDWNLVEKKQVNPPIKPTISSDNENEVFYIVKIYF